MKVPNTTGILNTQTFTNGPKLACQMRNTPHPYPRDPLHPVTTAAIFNQIGHLCGLFKTIEQDQTHYEYYFSIY